jgi:hypothetical protein
VNTVTFSKDEYGDCIASTGERIAKYESSELWGRGSGGWYITWANGELWAEKFLSQKDAKNFLIKKHNPIQYVEAVIAKFQTVAA